MSYRNLKPSDRSFIREQNDRIIQQMNNNAEYLATSQSFEAAKARMNEAYMAMLRENDPVKKEQLLELTQMYIQQAETIYNNWEAAQKEELRNGRRFKFMLWLALLFGVSYFFPLNLIALALFVAWWYRNYIWLRSEYH